ARAHMKLRQWEEAEADLAKALELKPDDADVRLERGQLYQERGLADKAAVEFTKAIEAKAKAVATRRETFIRAAHVRANRLALNNAYLALAKAQRQAGRPADAVATSLERAKLWPGYYLEVYKVACELAQCVPLVGKDGERTAEQEAQRRQYVDQAMEL